MELINLTPHEVKIVGDNGNVIASILSSGVARASQQDIPVDSIEFGEVSIPVVKTEFGEVTDLPGPTEGVAFIVSIITLNAAKAVGRSVEDLLITSNPVRDGEGKIIGCRALAHA